MQCISTVNFWIWKLTPLKLKLLFLAIEKPTQLCISYYNQVLDIYENFVYLGIMFIYNDRFLKTTKDWLSKLVKQCFLF